MKLEALIIGRSYKGNFGHGEEVCRLYHINDKFCYFRSQDKLGSFLIPVDKIESYKLMEIL